VQEDGEACARIQLAQGQDSAACPVGERVENRFEEAPCGLLTPTFLPVIPGGTTVASLRLRCGVMSGPVFCPKTVILEFE
jgi:hypothetical protein